MAFLYIPGRRIIRRILPGAAISTDIIAGFCGETEEQHKETLSIMEEVKYEMAYMFFYSERPGTLAAKRYEDDIPEEVKKRRLTEIIDLQRAHSIERNKADVDKTFEVLVEKPSKRSEDDLCGRNSQNKMIVFPKGNAKVGEYIQVKVTDYSQAILKGEIVA